MTLLGVVQKFIGASSAEWCCYCGIGNINLSLLCITRISDRFCVVSAFQADFFFCDISVILLFKLIGCLREVGFGEVIQSVIFFVLSSFERRVLSVNFDNSVLVLLKVCDTSYFFSVFVVAKSQL
jgi:hypothetical protein